MLRFVEFAHFKIVLHVVIITVLRSFTRLTAVRDVVGTFVVDMSPAYFPLQTTTGGSWGRKVEREGERQGERKGREEREG